MPMHPLIYLGNPNNPDGQILSKKTFEMVMTAVEQREGWLVIDESFIDFLDDTLSFRNQLAEHPRLVILLSLTKFYSVPGLRIGAAGSSRSWLYNFPDSFARGMSMDLHSSI